MEPYQERVVAEQRELAEKLERLRTFINGDAFKKLFDHEQVRLIRQCAAMQDYDEVLRERIDAFNVRTLG